jgi:hypothetical protein
MGSDVGCPAISSNIGMKIAGNILEYWNEYWNITE